MGILFNTGGEERSSAIYHARCTLLSSSSFAIYRLALLAASGAGHVDNTLLSARIPVRIL